MELTARDIATASGGSVILGAPEAVVSSFTMDSRVLVPGMGFVALRSARDGHDFVLDAFAHGATVAVVERPVAMTTAGSAGPPVLVKVHDTWEALRALGRFVRERLSAQQTPTAVVGITGSAGKTSTKDLVAAACAPQRRVHASPGSFNNEAGLPLSLLAVPDDVQVVVLEMGARFAGNIAELTEIARPDIGVITNIGLAHAGHLGGRSGVAAVKGELLDGLPSGGWAVLNDDCEATPALLARTVANVVRVGRTPRADVFVDAVRLDDELRPRFHLASPWGSTEVALEVRGEHQVLNAAMGVAVAAALGIPVEVAAAGVRAARSAPQRMELRRSPDDILVLDDSYNSSPTSAAAALHGLAALAVPGRRIAVLGAMLELGDDTLDEHRALGAQAAREGVDLVVAVGPAGAAIAEGVEAGGAAVVRVADADAAIRELQAQVRPGDGVLVKASRAAHLESVVATLLHRSGTPSGPSRGAEVQQS